MVADPLIAARDRLRRRHPCPRDARQESRLPSQAGQPPWQQKLQKRTAKGHTYDNPKMDVLQPEASLRCALFISLQGT